MWRVESAAGKRQMRTAVRRGKLNATESQAEHPNGRNAGCVNVWAVRV